MKIEGYMYYIVDSSGTSGLVPPLYYEQMGCKNKKGDYILSDDVPKNYFKKVEFLEENGWHRCYHYNLWNNPNDDNDYEYRLALSTDDVLGEYYPNVEL
jgi:hypothetical protein